MKPPKIETDDVGDQPSNGVRNAEIASTNQTQDSPSVQKWSKLKALIIVGFAVSVLTTFSDEVSAIATDINTQVKDLVGVDLQENGEFFVLPFFWPIFSAESGPDPNPYF